ncbi:MAG: sugar transferase, partial [Anaerovibrio sp.]
MKQKHMAQGRRIAVLLLVMADYLVLLSAEKTALWLQGIFRVDASSMMAMPLDYQYIYIPGVFLLIMLLAEGYRFNRPSLEMARDVFRGICFGFLMYMLLIFLMRNSMQISRYYAGCFWVFTFVYVALGRYVVGNIMLKAEALQERVLLIGAGKTAERLLSAFQDDFCYCYKVIGVLDDHPVSKKLPRQYPLLGGFADAARVIREQEVQTVIVAAPGLSEDGMRKLLMEIQHLTDTVLFTPSLVGSPLGSVEISTLFVEQVAVIKSKNNLSRWYNRWFKFCFDMVVTVLGSVLIAPILLGLALLVGIDNKGSVFFAHRRIGRNGREFPCYKFQTMVANADEVLVKYLSENEDARKEWESSFKLTDDPRVTRLGAFLRKTSLDELPQV